MGLLDGRAASLGCCFRIWTLLCVLMSCPFPMFMLINLTGLYF